MKLRLRFIDDMGPGNEVLEFPDLEEAELKLKQSESALKKCRTQKEELLTDILFWLADEGLLEKCMRKLGVDLEEE